MEYPVQFSVDYPDRRLSRLSAALRIFWVIPSTDDHQSVHLDYPYPDAARDLSPWLPAMVSCLKPVQTE